MFSLQGMCGMPGITLLDPTISVLVPCYLVSIPWCIGVERLLFIRTWFYTT